MFPYLVIVFLFLFLDRYDKGVEKKARVFVLAYIAIFMCGGYMCGSDWRGYELEYADPFSMINMGLEPGFYLLSYIAKLSGLSFWLFNILLKFVCLVVFFKFLKKYTINNKYIAFLVFFSFYGIYLFIDAPLRNLCAITIFLISLLVYEKSPVAAFFISIFSILFHFSGIIAVVFYLCRKFNIRTSIYVALYTIAVYISFNDSLLSGWASNTTIGRLLFAEKIDRYFVNGFGSESLVSSASTSGELLKILLFFLVVVRRKQIEMQPNGKHLFYGVMLFFIISKIGASMDVLMRFGCFVSPYYAIVMTMLIKVYYPRWRKLYKIALVSLAIAQICATITTDYRFIPYSNYFSYVIFHDQLPSYSERAIYNYKNTPYKK